MDSIPNTTKNKVAKILKITGFVFIVLGFILGLTLGFEAYNFGSELSWPVFFQWVATGFISGLVFIGISEIIELLHRINESLNNSKREIK